MSSDDVLGKADVVEGDPDLDGLLPPRTRNVHHDEKIDIAVGARRPTRMRSDGRTCSGSNPSIIRRTIR